MKEKSGHRPKVSSKAKRPDQQTYVIPSARANGDSCEYLQNFLHCSQSEYTHTGGMVTLNIKQQNIKRIERKAEQDSENTVPTVTIEQGSANFLGSRAG